MKKRRYVTCLECLGGSTESQFTEGGRLYSPPWVKEGYPLGGEVLNICGEVVPGLAGGDTVYVSNP